MSNPINRKTTMREAFEQAKVAEVTPLVKRIVTRMAKQDQRTSSRGRFAKRSAA